MYNSLLLFSWEGHGVFIFQYILFIHFPYGDWFSFISMQFDLKYTTSRQAVLDELKIKIDFNYNVIEVEVTTSQTSSLSHKRFDVACLHPSCNLLHSCDPARLLSLETRLTTSDYINHFSHFCGHSHVPLTKPGTCQADGGTAFFGHPCMHITDNSGIFDRWLAICNYRQACFHWSVMILHAGLYICEDWFGKWTGTLKKLLKQLFLPKLWEVVASKHAN